ncbi:IS3 family transposase [Streptomyces sp. NPDC048720]|uniref:IS3 family transposase n=1 Tax=Streptomyces sp. NPDC048720 TaxID=3365588 RepID=UPI003712C27B
MASHGFPARRTAALLDVSESGYYAWRTRTPSPRALRRAWLTRLVRGIHRESGAAYGYRRVGQELRDRYGIHLSDTTVEALMRAAGLRGRAGRLPATAPAGGARTPRRRWIVDVRAFTTPPGGLLYAAVVLDAASRRLIGWSTAATPDRALVHRAVMAAVTRAARHGEPGAAAACEPLPACSFTARAGSLGCAPVRAGVGDREDHAVVAAFWDTVHRTLPAPPSWPDTHVAESRLSTTFDRFARQAFAAGPVSPPAP